MSLPALRGGERKELALQGALEKLAPGPGSSARTRRMGSSRRSAGCRRSHARFAPFPPSIDPRLRARIRAPGDWSALQSSGRGLRPRRRRPQHRRHDAHGVRQDALLQPAGARCDPARSGARARCICFRPRRSRRIRWRSCTSSSERSATSEAIRLACTPTTATRRGCAAHDPHARARRAQQSRHAALGHPAAPPALGEAVREPPLHRHRRAARVSRRLRQPSVQRAAAACAASPGITAPIRRSSVRRRRSPTRASSPSGWPSGRSRSWQKAARRAARSFSSSSIRRSSTASSASAGRI